MNEISTPDDTTPSLPRLNEPAPNFQVKTTHGTKELSDYSGRWLILFSHPADFTPVCTTEFIAFAKAHPEFQKLNCDLLGLSIDSNFSHLAWARNIEEKFGVTIPFPIIEDLSMTVAHAYGMIMPGASDTSAVRTTFVIDPDGILRAMVYYPMSNGRSIAEFLRLVQALQVSDAHGVATPEGWQPGDQVIVPPPNTVDAANARKGEGYECVDWYFCKKDQPVDSLERTNDEALQKA
jgi:peroxiredoxin (alkyl hydroperoxide reductase subunit C)